METLLLTEMKNVPDVSYIVITQFSNLYKHRMAIFLILCHSQ